LGDELRSVVAADKAWCPTLREQPGQRAEHIVGGKAADHGQRQALPRVLVPDRQQLEWPAIGRLVLQEVVALHMVGLLRPVHALTAAWIGKEDGAFRFSQ
jgi:hypothetical protein